MSKRWPVSCLYGVTAQKTGPFTVISVRTSNPAHGRSGVRTLSPLTLGSNTNFTLFPVYSHVRGTWQRSWLRNYATNRKVAGSIPDKVI
jgi:hypothetical protein